MPTISAGALKRMLHPPANVVIGTPASNGIAPAVRSSSSRSARMRGAWAGAPNAAGMENKGANESYSVSWKRTKRELMQPDELGLLGTDECVYILRGVRLFRNRKIPAER